MQSLEFLWKDNNSGDGKCPALYATDGGYVVQGLKLDDATRAQLRQLAADEDGVFVPANVLDRLREASC
ncbi:MAG: lipid A biosynthesis lauroyl acyltransferase [Pseudonocardiales bacterium]|nr:MAG: lipid A biosynthesis lauroyl acyltransferase [Pseudonocardiales bacterium]